MATTRRALKTRGKRAASSRCRKLSRRVCKKTSGCKYTKGTKRRFCRKSRNTRRH